MNKDYTHSTKHICVHIKICGSHVGFVLFQHVMVAFTYGHIILMGLLMGCVIDCVLSKWIHFTLAAVMDLHTSRSVVSMTSGSNDTRFSVITTELRRLKDCADNNNKASLKLPIVEYLNSFFMSDTVKSPLRPNQSEIIMSLGMELHYVSRFFFCIDVDPNPSISVLSLSSNKLQVSIVLL